jgi:hypothetical protein
LSGGAGDLG